MANTVSQHGLEGLRVELNRVVEEMCPESSFLVDSAILEKCERHLELAAISRDAAIMCSNIDAAQQQIAELTSNLVAEDVLDHIFDKFCIGK
ncbi:unnamed protein product [Caenorhabditis angaria]|uniref:MnmE helical domain-containing protein n=1 Tax=Caenorhabditis angaria TaxID=860376 RepID=A0A9P1I377_9PELO|nr:unnamed protein product [Caenorhabditis angaria]